MWLVGYDCLWGAYCWFEYVYVFPVVLCYRCIYDVCFLDRIAQMMLFCVIV